MTDTDPLEPAHLAGNRLLLAPEQTMLRDGPVRGHAVVVADGVFLDVGQAPAVIARHPDLTPVRLPRTLLMPGFIDAHHHLSQTFGKALAFGEPSEIFRRIWVPLEGSMDAEMVYLAAKLGALEALRGGFTTVVDAGTRSAGDVAAIATATTEAGLRCVLGAICNDLGGGTAIGAGSAIGGGTANGGDTVLGGGTAIGAGSAIDGGTAINYGTEAAAILAAADRHLARWQGDALVHASLAVSIPEAASDAMLRAVSARCAEAGAIFQTHANEHLVAVERSLVARGFRPIQLLHHLGVLGPQVLLAHATLLTPDELAMLRDTGTAIAYNPVATQWKGNAAAPAELMARLGIRFGIGTDGTRADGFRMVDAAEATQRLVFGLAAGDFSCGGGWLWLDHATTDGADAIGLGARTGRIEPGYAADFLLVDLEVPEMLPSWDLTWELVRLANRDQITAVFVAGRLRLWRGWPLDWDGRALLRRVAELAESVLARAPIQRIHPVSTAHRKGKRANEA